MSGIASPFTASVDKSGTTGTLESSGGIDYDSESEVLMPIKAPQSVLESDFLTAVSYLEQQRKGVRFERKSTDIRQGVLIVPQSNRTEITELADETENITREKA